jgi:hypothetical protein
MLKQFALLIAAGSLVSACMSATDNAAITNAVAEFHNRQARGDDAAIYQGATPDLRTAASLQDLARLDAAVRAIQGCSAPGANLLQSYNASGMALIPAPPAAANQVQRATDPAAPAKPAAP